jgi:pimeloyl-ACP methyl ester carboxylesterase
MAASLVDTAGSGPKTVYVLHGILGSGRNWRSFARRLVAERDDLTVHLVDQRAHGSAPPSSGPHTLAACADDLAALEARHGSADVVVGHSFGGKVALAWAEGPGRGAVWVLDSPPGLPDGQPTAESHDALGVLAALRSCPTPVATRSELRQHLRDAGLPEGIVMWLLTSSRRDADGWRWVFDLPAVDELLADYFRRDLWPVALSGHPVTLVKAERSDRWTAHDLEQAEAADASGRIGWAVIEDAGHWLHVDNPDALLQLFVERL